MNLITASRKEKMSVIWFKKRWTHSGGVEVQMRLSTSNIWCQSMNPACWINSGKFWTVRLTYLVGHGRLAISEIFEGWSDFRINTVFLSETLCYNRRILFVLVIFLVWLCSNHSYILNKYLVCREFQNLILYIKNNFIVFDWSCRLPGACTCRRIFFSEEVNVTIN